MTNELLQINKENYMYVDWKTKSTTTEMYNNKKINVKIFEKNINRAELKEHIIITHFEIMKTI